MELLEFAGNGLAKLVVCLGFVSTLMIPAVSQTAKPTIESSLSALQAGDPQTAYAIAQKLVETEPGEVKAWLLMGTALSILKRNRESLRAFHRALDLQPDSLAAPVIISVRAGRRLLRFPKKRAQEVQKLRGS